MTASTATQQIDKSRIEEIRDALAKISYFEDLPDSVLQDLADASDERCFGAGETVFTMNQYDGDELFCIISGKAKLTTVSVETDALSVEELSEGSIFGLEYVLGDFQENILQAGLTASTALVIITIDSHHLQEIVKRKPVVARAFLAGFARQLLKFKAGQSAPQADPHKRIFQSLFDLIERDDNEVPAQWRVAQMPKHRELGEIAGTTEIEAAEAVARLISEGIAKRDYPGLIIADYTAFHSLAL